MPATEDIEPHPDAIANAVPVPQASATTGDRLAYLVVDVDGTLLRTDLFHEGLLAALHQAPLVTLLSFPRWLAKGKAFVKQRVAELGRIDVTTLPVNAEVVKFIAACRAEGMTIVLATAADQILAGKIRSHHQQVIDAVLASDGTTNLAGAEKLAAIRKLVGQSRFGYIGNERRDLAVWNEADQVYVVERRPGLSDWVRRTGVTVHGTFQTPRPSLRQLLSALRVHQWVKNLLIFVPLIASHHWHDVQAWAATALYFFAFSLVASAMYLLNDLLDLQADREHPRKRLRAIASGEIPVLTSAVLIPLLLALGFGLAGLTGLVPTAFLAAYAVATTAYSVHLKSFALIDVLVLAFLYTLRVVAGGVVAGTPASHWLFAFSMFFFLSLATVKRCAELFTLSQESKPTARRRDYRVTDLDTIRSLGVSAGYISVLVLALFISAPDTTARYSRPEFLWLVCPAVLYLIGRLWLKTSRGQMQDDPLLFFVRDRGTRWVLIFCAAVVVLSL